MPPTDYTLNMALRNLHGNTASNLEDVAWNTVYQLIDIIKAQKNDIEELQSKLSKSELREAKKDGIIELLTKENEMLRSKQQQNTAAPVATLPPDSEAPSPAQRFRSSKKNKPIDPDVVARIKQTRDHAAVCDKALTHWQRLIDAGLINENLMPTTHCGVTTAARIVCRLQTEVDDSIKWSFFERRWKISHLQSSLSRTAYKDMKYYALVNRAFNLADDAPFVCKNNRTQ